MRNNRLVRWLFYILFWGLILYLITAKYVDQHTANRAVRGIFGAGWQFVVDIWDVTAGRLFHGHHGVSVH